MTDLCAVVLNALQRQAAGHDAAESEIRRVIDLMGGGGGAVYRDPKLMPQQVRGMELVLAEWRGMFSFYPGRKEGLAPLTRLVSLICRNSQIEQLKIYDTTEWKEIVNLRGPVETVLITKCHNCATEYPRMGTSGFLDIIDLLCNACGGIHFHSAYSIPEQVVCPCGGKAKMGCPSCGATRGTTVDEISPYKYFAKHALYRHQS